MLTELACKKAEPGPKEIKLADAGGLYLRVRPTGAKSWCWKYRFAGKEKKLVIGPYPKVSLKAARLERDRARGDLAQGKDPAGEKQRRKAEAALAALDNFEKVARACHGLKALTWSDRYAAAVLSRLKLHAFPTLGPVPIKSITPPLVLAVIRAIEAKGSRHMAHKVRNHISDVFVWAIASGIAEQDPAAVIQKALEPMDPKKRPALVKLEHARDVLTKTEGLTGAHWSTLLASRLLALTAARPGVVRLAEREEFEGLDGKHPIWRVPAEKMKLTRQQKRDITWEFIVPLSSEALAVVKAALAASPSDRWLFPGLGSWRTPISDSTLSKLYRDAGFTGRHVPHGWRSSFSTIMNELAAIEDRESDRAIIDLMLAHAQEGVEPIYNRAVYMPRRRELAQTWATMLMKGMAPPDTLTPDKRRWRAREAVDDGSNTA
jgi:hypothetical protein